MEEEVILSNVVQKTVDGKQLGPFLEICELALLFQLILLVKVL